MKGLAELETDIRIREHALAKLDERPHLSAADLRTRRQLSAEINALCRQRAAEETREAQLREWIAPREVARG